MIISIGIQNLKTKPIDTIIFITTVPQKYAMCFLKSLRSNLTFDGSFIKTDYTIRELTDLYLKPQPWGDLGIDICLGLPMDKEASAYEYMFLPDYIESSFDHAMINNQPIVKKKNIVYAPNPEDDSFELFHPWIIFGFFLALTLALCFYDWKRKTVQVV
ncbi:MAG: hypothetical protein U5K54_20245 [Cytophagales bacterium]|nr:hypothetical protein [Cytophagales bacterium]